MADTASASRGGSPVARRQASRKFSPKRPSASPLRSRSPSPSPRLDAVRAPLDAVREPASNRLDAVRRPPLPRARSLQLEPSDDSVRPPSPRASPKRASTPLVDESERVKVHVRLRPLHTAGEAAVRTDASRIWVAGERDAPMQFECDRVLDGDDGQAAVYDEAARPLVSAVAAGGTACLMCYGQTGTGKTYTLGGGGEAEPQRGVVDRALEQLLGGGDGDGGGLKVRMCYIEVYMEVIHDLLRAESTPQLREHPESGTYVDGVAWRDSATSTTRAPRCAAERRRHTALTQMNASSSRSHSVLLSVERDAARFAAGASGGGAVGRLYLVDLAGSERTKRSGVTGAGFDEACSINASLTTLGRCVQALAAPRSGKGSGARAPFRDSKLTRLLSPCLSGAARAAVCASLRPPPTERDLIDARVWLARDAGVAQALRQQAVDYRALASELQLQLDARDAATQPRSPAVRSVRRRDPGRARRRRRRAPRRRWVARARRRRRRVSRRWASLARFALNETPRRRGSLTWRRRRPTRRRRWRRRRSRHPGDRARRRLGEAWRGVGARGGGGGDGGAAARSARGGPRRE